MSKSVFVTGANGFIGKRVISVLRESGYEVWAGVRATSDRTDLALTEAKIVSINMSNKEHLAADIYKCPKWDYVVHLAGLTKALRKRDFTDVNCGNTQRLIEVLIAMDRKPDKFIFVSSLSAANPTTLYGKSKRDAERYITSMKYKLNSTILRPTGVYGAGEQDYAKMISAVKMGFDIQAGLKKQTLTFVYVDDVARAVKCAIESENVSANIYNISDGGKYSASDFSLLIAKELGKHVRRIRVPLCLLWLACMLGECWSWLTRKPSTFNLDKFRIMKQRSWVCDITAARKDLGYEPQYSLAAGVKAMMKAYNTNNITLI